MSRVRFVIGASIMMLVLSTDTKGATYYVDIQDGDNSFPGQSVGYAWKTLQHAADNISPADRVFVRARAQTYQPFEVKCDYVSFIGYNTLINGESDLDDGDGVPAEFSEMLLMDSQPIIDGVSTGGRSDQNNNGVEATSKTAVAIRNFTIRNCNTGLKLTTCDYADIKNLLLYDFGDINAHYDGCGIQVAGLENFRDPGVPDSIDNYIENCVVWNAAAEGIQLAHTFCNHIYDCKVYSSVDTNNAATDYYFLITNGDANSITGCVAL